MTDVLTDAERLAARGVPVMLAEGEARLRFDFTSLQLLEEHYGSLGRAAEALVEMLGTQLPTSANAEKGLMSTKVVAHLGVFLQAGLEEHPEPSAALALLPVDNMRQVLLETATQCVAAWNQAFPRPSAEGNPTPPTGTSGSPGPTSGGSAPAPAVAANGTSGG